MISESGMTGTASRRHIEVTPSTTNAANAAYQPSSIEQIDSKSLKSESVPVKASMMALNDCVVSIITLLRRNESDSTIIRIQDHVPNATASELLDILTALKKNTACQALYLQQLPTESFQDVHMKKLGEVVKHCKNVWCLCLDGSYTNITTNAWVTFCHQLLDTWITHMYISDTLLAAEPSLIEQMKATCRLNRHKHTAHSRLSNWSVIQQCAGPLWWLPINAWKYQLCPQQLPTHPHVRSPNEVNGADVMSGAGIGRRRRAVGTVNGVWKRGGVVEEAEIGNSTVSCLCGVFNTDGMSNNEPIRRVFECCHCHVQYHADCVLGSLFGDGGQIRPSISDEELLEIEDVLCNACHQLSWQKKQVELLQHQLTFDRNNGFRCIGSNIGTHSTSFDRPVSLSTPLMGGSGLDQKSFVHGGVRELSTALSTTASSLQPVVSIMSNGMRVPSNILRTSSGENVGTPINSSKVFTAVSASTDPGITSSTPPLPGLTSSFGLTVKKLPSDHHLSNTNSNGNSAGNGLLIKLPDGQNANTVTGLLPGPSKLLLQLGSLQPGSLQPGSLLLGSKYMSPLSNGATTLSPSMSSNAAHSPDAGSINAQHEKNTYLQFMNNGNSSVPSGNQASGMTNIQIPSMFMFNGSLPNSTNSSPHMNSRPYPKVPRVSPAVTSPHIHAEMPSVLLTANQSLNLVSHPGTNPGQMLRPALPHNAVDNMSTANSASNLNRSTINNTYIPIPFYHSKLGCGDGEDTNGLTHTHIQPPMLDPSNPPLSNNPMSQWNQFYQLPPNPAHALSHSTLPNHANMPNYLDANASLLLKSSPAQGGGKSHEELNCNSRPGYYMQNGKDVVGNVNTVNDIVPSASMFAMPYQPPFGPEGSNDGSNNSRSINNTNSMDTSSNIVTTSKSDNSKKKVPCSGPSMSSVDGTLSQSSDVADEPAILSHMARLAKHPGMMIHTNKIMNESSLSSPAGAPMTDKDTSASRTLPVVKKDVTDLSKTGTGTSIQSCTAVRSAPANDTNSGSDAIANTVGSDKEKGAKRKRIYKTSSAYYVPALGVGSEVWIVSVKKSGVVKEEKNGGWKYVLFHTPIVGSGVVPSKPSLEAAALHNQSRTAGKQLDVIEGKWCRSCDLTSWPLKTGNGAEGDVGLHTGALHKVRKRDRHRIPNVEAIVSANNMASSGPTHLMSNSHAGVTDENILEDWYYAGMDMQQLPYTGVWVPGATDEEKHLLSPTASVVIDLRQKRARSLTCCSNDSDVQAAAAAVNVMRPRGGSDLYMYPILATDEDDQDMLDDYASALTNELTGMNGQDNDDYLSSDPDVDEVDEVEVDLISLAEFDSMSSPL